MSRTSSRHHEEAARRVEEARSKAHQRVEASVSRASRRITGGGAPEAQAPEGTVKRSVTIQQATLQRLSPERTANLSRTVSAGLDLVAALDAQWALVADWEAEHGTFTDEELKPYVETVVRAQVDHMLAESRWRTTSAASDGP